MSEKFNWQAEDDVVWEDLPADDEAQQTSRKRHRWPILLLIVLLLAGATAVILRQVNRRVETNSQAMRADILSTRNLLQIAQAEQDEELFFSILSGRDSDWTAAQQDLFKAGLLQDRTPFGLQSQANRNTILAAEDDSLNITFSPDMLEAEMMTEQPFTINIGSSLTETVTLQETSIYRLGRNQWLLAPPESGFWGSRESLQGAQLRISFPARDMDIVNRLLPDLERKLDEMCRTLVDIECPIDRPVEIQFSTDPATLAAIIRPQAARQTNNALRVTLPTPTLVGIPLDEASYQALFRGYASQLVTALISRHVGYTCCQQLPFYQALVDYQLDQLSLKPWPVTADDYERIRDQQMQLTDLAGLWYSENPDDLLNEEGWRVYAVVDYLIKADPEISPAALQRELLRRGSFFGWLNGLFSSQSDSANADLHSNLMRQFWLQAFPQATQAGSGFSGPPLEQDLQLICMVSDEEGSGEQISKLLRYDVIQDNWQEEYSTSNHLFMNPLPGDDKLLILEMVGEQGQWQTSIWRDGRLNPIIGAIDDYSISFGQTDPSGAGLMAFVFPPDGSDADITLFDLNNCGEEVGCASQILPGIPVWSPDGSQAVFGDQPNIQLGLLQSDERTILFDSSAPTQNLSLYHGNRQTLMEDEPVTAVADLTNVGQGHAPFWLDSETIAYVALANGRFSRPSQEVVYTPAGEDNRQTLLTTNDLMQVFPDPASVERLFWIHYVMAHPADPDMLFVTAFGAWDQQAHVFSYERSSGQAKHLMNAGYTANHTLSLSPDGRFLVLTGNDVDDPDRQRKNALLLVHNLALGENTPFLSIGTDFPPFPSYDWSADGQWLAMMLDHNLLGLYAPQQSALHLVKTSAGDCASPSWTNR
jgi:Tol biopolymer transport system component